MMILSEHTCPEIEEWRAVSGNERYEVSNLGKVRNARTKRPVSARRYSGGYLQVGLYRPGKVTDPARVHRLVARAFLESSEKPIVRHLDGDPAHNCANNLAWGTHEENMADSIRHGRTRYQERRYTNEQVKVMRALHEDRVSFITIRDQFGISERYLRSILSGEYRKRVR